MPALDHTLISPPNSRQKSAAVLLETLDAAVALDWYIRYDGIWLNDRADEVQIVITSDAQVLAHSGCI
jgi:hypothetical protein